MAVSNSRGRPEAQRCPGKRDIEQSLIALAAVFDAQQVNVIRHGDGVERAFDIQRIDRRGELVIRSTHIGTMRGILAARGAQQLRRPPAARKNDMREKRLRGIRHVRHFVQRQPQLVMRLCPMNGQIAGAHAHDMREHRAGQQDESSQESHAGASGTACTFPAASRCWRMCR
jgi:hypothetical protein